MAELAEGAEPEPEPEPGDSKAASGTGAPPPPEPEKFGKEAGGKLDRFGRRAISFPPWVYFVALVLLAVAVFPFEMPEETNFVDAIFANQVVLLTARLLVPVVLLVGLLFLLRSLAAAMEQGKFIDQVAGIRLNQEAVDALRKAEQRQLKAQQDLGEVTAQLQTTSTQLAEVVAERDELEKQLARLQGETPRRKP